MRRLLHLYWKFVSELQWFRRKWVKLRIQICIFLLVGDSVIILLTTTSAKVRLSETKLLEEDSFWPKINFSKLVFLFPSANNFPSANLIFWSILWQMYTIFPPLDPTGYHSMNSMLLPHLVLQAVSLHLDFSNHTCGGCFCQLFRQGTLFRQVVLVYLP